MFFYTQHNVFLCFANFESPFTGGTIIEKKKGATLENHFFFSLVYLFASACFISQTKSLKIAKYAATTENEMTIMKITFFIT